MTTFPDELSELNVVLCHDWLTGMRGGERVLEILCQAFPRAPIYTLIHNPAAVSAAINRHSIHASWLQRVPGIMRRYRGFLPLFPATIERFRLPPADLIISTSHCVAKGIRPPPGVPHLCYCFTPMRYAWLFQNEYLGRNPLKRALAAPLLAALRRWDRRASVRVDRFVAISRNVQHRIRDFYGRAADVVHPPVDTEHWTPAGPPLRGYDLIVSALVPYKRLDLAIRAYAQIGYPLKIVGVGSELARLRALAGPHVTFLGWQTDEQVLQLYRNCRMLVFPGEEDFGLVPLEAQACGRPVVAFARGGAEETVRHGVTGVLFAEQSERALTAAVTDCADRRWDRAAIRAHAEQFGVAPFVQGLAARIAETLKQSTIQGNQWAQVT
jgi:glycosyltransferase involved in cell wall biosynthesis